jgi:oligoribonuclease
MNPTKLLWVDVETTGLDPLHDALLEIAAAETPLDRPLHRGSITSCVFGFHDALGCTPFIRDLHTANGLFADCRASLLTPAMLDEAFCRWFPDEYIVAGSSVHFDLAFIRVNLPNFAKRLSHRCYDVSAIRLFCQSLGCPEMPKGVTAHRAHADIDASIAEAHYYSRYIQVPQ